LYSIFCRLSSVQPQPQKRARVRCRAAAFPKVFVFRERRNTEETQFPPVMPLPENRCSTSFTTGYKRLTEGGHEAFE
jgi:hypothetical protein